MTDSDSRRSGSHHVFLCHSSSDRQIVERIATELSNAGTKVWYDEFEIKSNTSLTNQIEQAISASDIMVVLLSKDSTKSKWVQKELEIYSREMDERAVILLPVILDDCDLPPILQSRQYFDLRSNVESGIGTLASRLSLASRVDLSALSEREFTELVADLLESLDFKINLTTKSGDQEIDMIAKRNETDPSGREQQQTYIVECKSYRHGRADLDSVRKLIRALEQDSKASAGLLVTTGQFTSPVREWAEVQAKRGVRLKLMDGTELRELLVGQPEVVRKHLTNAR